MITKYPHPPRLRRCQLSVPGSSEKMMNKAASMDVDYVFLDLEDAVAPDKKKEARGKIVEALNTLDFGRTTRCVRINDPASHFCYGDLIEVVSGAGRNLDMIIVPKVLDADDVLFVDKLLSQIEKDLGLERKIGIECLIEEVEAMMNVERIAASTPRLEGLIFGMGDYSASQGVPITSIGGESGYPGDIWHYQRTRMTIACRAHGIDAVDGPFGDFSNPEAYRREATRAATLGMVGKWAIHPSQVAVAQEVFSPTQAQVDEAREMYAAFEKALSEGLGAVQFKGQMIDIASVRHIRNIVQRADAIGM
ncbi:HpcH/HpaI aldolase/citrate lyase family protein [Mesorhizobium australicum]|uniref:Citrate lyase subunit beta / citryl-CoA lyase n=1 Tax=Mesorhizobium australicum TaxID=536018 RepID=A0A1X7PW79_9HYPH|nr:CoA ester lyase [Mesorhizobium australicum]SMH56465.1 citrate lyase subunit beta / citryl-CoA lyase [Mesorhizobium australicum]